MSTKRTQKKSNKKKPKVQLNKNKVIVLTSVLVGLCIISLVVSTITSNPKVTNLEETVESVKIVEVSKKISQDDTKVSPQDNQNSSLKDNSKSSLKDSSKGSPMKSLNETNKTKDDTNVSSKSSDPVIKTDSVKISQTTSAKQSTTTATKKSDVAVSSNKGSAASQSEKKSAGETKSQQKSTTPSESKKSESSVTQKKQEVSSASAKKQDAVPVSSPKKSNSAGAEIASVSTKKTEEPKIQEIKRSPFNIPTATKGATLVFVIDDAGLNVDNVKAYANLPFPITIAVLPKLKYSAECARAARAAGKEVILHQPMQASNLNISPGPGAITPDMNSYEIAATLKENIREVGPVKGLNNHEGSLITENAIKIGFILDVATDEGLYFLDSRTTSATQARQAALERDIRIFERNAPFLDNAISREEMLNEIYKGLAIANKSGTAIIIGHVDKSVKILPVLLKEMYPYLVEAGYRFAVPSAL